MTTEKEGQFELFKITKLSALKIGDCLPESDLLERDVSTGTLYQFKFVAAPAKLMAVTQQKVVAFRRKKKGV